MAWWWWWGVWVLVGTFLHRIFVAMYIHRLLHKKVTFNEMSLIENEETIQLLQRLLTESKDETSESHFKSDVQSQIAGANFVDPILIDSCPEPSSTTSATVADKKDNIQCKFEPETVEEWEKQEKILAANEFDDRETPEYQIIYEQSVTTEDIYLHTGNKTASTASCEKLCIEIKLPNESVGIEQMELDVNSNDIDLKTLNYRLRLPLVQTIDPDYGKAQWNPEQKILRLYLLMKREYDCVNF